MDRVPDLADITVKIRTDVNAESALRKSITRDSALNYEVVNGPDADRAYLVLTVHCSPRLALSKSFWNVLVCPCDDRTSA